MSLFPDHAHPGQFRKPGAPPREEILDEVYEDELDLQRSGSYLNSSIASAWSERSLDPGDIRVGAVLTHISVSINDLQHLILRELYPHIKSIFITKF